MKKSPLIIAFIAAIFLSSCNLISSAGLSSKGLPTNEAPEELPSTTANSEVNVDHSEWNTLLKKHVSNEGLVDYKGFMKDRAQLNAYLSKLSEMKPTKDWSVQEQLAYYINIYNAYTVDLILNNYPTKSIKDIDGPWTKDIVPIGDVDISLGGVENSILRKMNEPRIHFAINCASSSCPKLLNEAYTAAKINEQLDRATKEFVNSDKNEISKNSAKLSSIFDWYKKDFTENGMTLLDYVNKYSNVKIDAGTAVNYKDYDWNLNEQK
ncbi:DUF547 domain-containing protein [Gillisia marina]|uniref:DUF547 domain-containing protein n=1 Tax=Gillisia marina TaxID=1167637 RepID=UPI00029AABF4|nr:DUF547 domain-containing protein [Gillisia marina]